MIKFTIITLFPEAIEPYLKSSMMEKATRKGLAEFELINLRDFGLGPHKSVDDTPYGGGDGMLLRCEPVFAAIESIKAKNKDAKIILPTPVGQIWHQRLAKKLANTEASPSSEGASERNQELVKCTSRSFATTGAIDEASPSGEGASKRNQELVKCTSRSFATTGAIDEASPSGEGASEEDREVHFTNSHYAILCPHYEGYDERILSIVDYKISMGKYILTGGELPALIIIDSVVRLIPGVLGGEKSAEIESFSDGDNLEYPQYTRPENFRGMKVPEVLLSGNHAEIAKWREANASHINQKL